MLSAHFWSTGVFFDAAELLVEFAFTTMQIDRLEARIALRNRRAHAAVRKLGARPKSTTRHRQKPAFRAIRRWCGRCASRIGDTGRVILVCQPTTAASNPDGEAAQNELRRSEFPEAVEPYPLFLFDRRRK